MIREPDRADAPPHALRLRRRTSLPAALALAAALAACGKGAAPETGGGGFPPSLVTAATAQAQDVPVYVDAIGRCVASEVVSVMPQVTGRLLEVVVADGADVAAKAPLFRIDPRPFDARLAEARARVTSAEAGVAEAKAAVTTAGSRVASAKTAREQLQAAREATQAMAEAARGDTAAAASDQARAAEDLRRLEEMANSGAVSQQDRTRARADASAAEARLTAARRREAAAAAQVVEAVAAERSGDEAIREATSRLAEAEARVRTAEAELVRATAAVEPARLDTEYCEITAPLAGRAGRRLVDRGNIVTAGVTPLLSLQRLDPIHVEFTVTESELAAVQAAMRARAVRAEVRLPEAAAGTGAPAAAATARTGDVFFLDNAVVEGTGSVRLRVKLDNPDGHLWPGRFARVRVLLDTHAGAVLIPASAPQPSQAGFVVFVVRRSKDPATGAEVAVAAMEPVVLSQRHGDRVVVLSGVKPGEEVVVERQMFLFPGAPVVVAPPPGTGAPPPSGTGVGGGSGAK